jgi:hypothetical protein
MSSQPSVQYITINLGLDIAPEELEHSTSQLLGELRELEFISIETVAGPPPPSGTRSGEAMTLGQIIVALTASGGVLTALIGVLKDRVARAPGSITIEMGGDKLTIVDPSNQAEQSLTDAWIAKHRG